MCCRRVQVPVPTGPDGSGLYSHDPPPLTSERLRERHLRRLATTVTEDIHAANVTSVPVLRTLPEPKVLPSAAVADSGHDSSPGASFSVEAVVNSTEQ